MPGPMHRPEKAYRNMDFLNSREARGLRIISEYLEPYARFHRFAVEDTIVFFGSARVMSPDTAARELEAARREGDAAVVERAERAATLARYYDDARSLARRMTAWSKDLSNTRRRFIVASGAGPGIMEAANRGASESAGLSVGLGISLPNEPTNNPYVSRELSFEFHYFFMRKFWFAYLAKALVIFPGGFGTLDELFEILTLVQTGKSRKKMPIVLYGTRYWEEVLNFEPMLRWGTISPGDPDLVHRCDDVDCAFEYLTGELTRLYLDPESEARGQKPVRSPAR